jgi:hypothetical protein
VWEVLAEEADLILRERNRSGSGTVVAKISDDPHFRTLHQGFLNCQRDFREYARMNQVRHGRGEGTGAQSNEAKQNILQIKQEKADRVRVAEEEVANFVYRRLHEAKLSALCLSGGGIRSATFSLGVIEGLSQGSVDHQGEPAHLLREIDYLSTVSGGGYIGGWFSSWVHRKQDADATVGGVSEDPIATSAGVPEVRKQHPDATVSGVSEVIKALNSGQLGKFDREAAPVSFLREFSNYLNPRLGVTSADTWALIATYLRNVLLNWVVLLPLIGSVLLVPVLFLKLLPVLGSHKVAPELWFWGATDMLAAVCFAFLCVALPATEIANPKQNTFLRFWLLPAFLASLFLSLYVRVEQHVFYKIIEHPLLWSLPVLGALVFVLVYAQRSRGAIDWKWALLAFLVLLVVSVLSGAAVMEIVDLLPEKWDVGSEQLYTVFAVPAVLLLGFAAMALLVGLSSKLTEDEDREWLARAGGWLLVIACAWLLLAAIGVYGPCAGRLVWSAVSSAVSGWVLSLLGKSPKTPASSKLKETISDLPAGVKTREVAAMVLLPVFLLLLFITLSQANDKLWHVLVGLFPGEMAKKPEGEVFAVLALFVAELVLSVGAAIAVNVNKFSLHGMYRLRLVRAYLGASRPNRTPNFFTGFDPDDNVRLKELQHRPVHVVNMAWNLVAGKRLSWQQRKAASFTATPLHAGSFWWGYREVDRYSEEKGMTLGGAMTISGAAASPNMGYHSSALLTTIMTLFNARLGAWLGNPSKPNSSTWQKNGPVFGWRSYIDELLGLTNEKSNWVYLSDGGHFENLGIYEMVVRRCYTIIVVDGGCDPEYTFEDLANAVRKIRIDLGVPIEFANGVAIKKDPDNQHHWAIGTIKYSAVDGTPVKEDGRLIYIKASITGDEPADVAQYHRATPVFPHESTADQWFSESQFESYRVLGQHIATKIVGDSCSATLEEFVQRASHQAAPKAPRVRQRRFLATRRGVGSP